MLQKEGGKMESGKIWMDRNSEKVTGKGKKEIFLRCYEKKIKIH